jgi:hypothetical protein
MAGQLYGAKLIWQIPGVSRFGDTQDLGYEHAATWYDRCEHEAGRFGICRKACVFGFNALNGV